MKQFFLISFFSRICIEYHGIQKPEIILIDFFFLPSYEICVSQIIKYI